jgi:hypothetical protein
METSVAFEKSKKQDAEFIFQTNRQIALELESGINELQTYLKGNALSFAVAEDMGDKHLILAKMQGRSIDNARLAGNTFLHAADIAAEDANKRKAYGPEEFETVKRNLQKAKESFELYAAKAENQRQAKTSREYLERIEFLLASFVDGPFKLRPENALRSYPDSSIRLPCKRER